MLNYEHFLGVSEVASVKPILQTIVPSKKRTCRGMHYNYTLNGNFLNDRYLDMYRTHIGEWRRLAVHKNTFDAVQYEYLFVWKTHKYPIQVSGLDTYLEKEKTFVYMIGASHMREFFFYILGKHRDSILENNHEFKGSQWGIQFRFVTLAIQQKKYLEELCKKLEVGKDGTSAVIILQTGDLDLLSYSSRVVIRDHRIGQGLVDLIADIVTGFKRCGFLKKFVFVTPVPYPFCRQNTPSRCEEKRGFRSNDAINAIRQFFLGGLSKAIRIRREKRQEKRSEISLEVVDAFSIIRSRLIYEDEVFKLNHYLCWCNETKMMYESPGGRESGNGIMLAISNGEINVSKIDKFQREGNLNQNMMKNRCLER